MKIAVPEVTQEHRYSNILPQEYVIYILPSVEGKNNKNF